MFALALVSLVFTSAQAQKQLGEEHNIEVNLTPFANFSSDSSSTMFGGNVIDGSTLKYRYFLDDDKALRVRIGLGVNNNEYAYIQAGEATEVLDPNLVNESEQLNLRTNSFTFGIDLGYEMHFGGTDNLSPYFGVEGGWGVNSVSHTKQFWGPNDLGDEGEYGNYVTWELTNSQAQQVLRLGLVFGVDYYFSDAIYIGFETGLGVSGVSFKNHEISTQLESGGDSMTAFNMQFNNATTTNPDFADMQIADSFVGQLSFDALTDMLYSEYLDGNEDPSTWMDGQNGPNHISNFMFGNVFNAALRFGYLFD